jgi:hypothetical protein
VSEWTRVSTAAELVEAVRKQVPAIEVDGLVRGMPMITLAPGVRLRGGTLEFGAKGVRLTRDNVLSEVAIHCPDDEVAVLNDTSVRDFGELALRGVRTRGQVLLLARDAVAAGRVVVDGLTVGSADVRGRVDRPRGFGVEALQGAFTLWNQQPDPAVVIEADLLDLAVGGTERPVRGSGVFVGGHGDWSGTADGGSVRVTTLRTGEIHTDGGIPEGTPDLISAGVFVISGAEVDRVVNAAPVTTRGANDMVLDNWGRVGTWEAHAPVTSHGPSGIGFVNFGELDRLDVRSTITTHGTGARGFNVYDGSLRSASFDAIETTGDGAVGIQVSRRLPRLEVRGDLTTSGGSGSSLVRGVQVRLQAVALSVKPGGHIDEATVGGEISARGNAVVAAEIDGEVGSLRVDGGIHVHGHGSDALHLREDLDLDLDGITITSAHGRQVVHRPMR